MVEKNMPMAVSTNTCKRRWRFASATLFAATLGTCVVLAGCAATDEVVETPPQPSQVSSEPALSPTMTIALQNCVAAEASQLSRHSYEISFEIDASSVGVVRGVEVKGRGLDHAGIETCMIQVLENLYVRQYLPQEELFQSSPQSSLPSSRVLLGTTAVLPQLIRLAPIVLTVPGGITIVVGVVIVVAVAAVASLPKRPKPTKEECDEEKRLATIQCLELISWNDPPLEVVGPKKNLEECLRNTLTEDCGGKPLDWGKRGRPGRRF